ncbi:MAG: hypothetical protein JW811_10560 [Clostridiales bacterium]|nr:hypothetical protein [Clostridiales bacterium]
MNYQQKRTITSIIGTVAVFTVYYIYVIGKLNAAAVTLDDVKFFAVTMLTFIGIGIAVTIAVQVTFHILFSVSVAVHERGRDGKELEGAINAAMVEDERDKLIDLKSMRVTFIISSVGFVAGLILLALEHPVGLALNILFGAAGLGTVAQDVSKLIYYKVR